MASIKTLNDYGLEVTYGIHPRARYDLDDTREPAQGLTTSRRSRC